MPENWTLALRRSLDFLVNLWKTVFRSVELYLLKKSQHIQPALPHRRREVANAILEQPRHQDFLHSFSRETGIPLEAVEATFRRYVNEIASDLHYAIIPFWDSLLRWVFDVIYEGLEINTESLEKLRDVAGRKPVVFVSSHRSHMDYLLLSYIFFQQRIPLPLVCAGENLSFWPLGPIFRKSGAFFIRRSYEGNKLYAAAVQAYTEQALRDKVPVEFFIEGTRSRTGKLLPPKTGFLASLYRSYENIAEDVQVIPTAITYDSVLEEKSYLSEQTGSFKKNESVRDLWSLRKHLRTKKGKVYIRFGDPLSLAEFDAANSHQKDRRQKIRDLSYDITYGINRASVVTPSALVAMAVLTHRRRSISRTEIEKKVDLYLDYLRYKESPLSLTLQKYRTSAIRESLKNTVRLGLLEEIADEAEPLYAAPAGRRSLLDYYKNTALHYFVSMGVLASLLRANNTETVSRNQIEKDYAFLQHLFQHEFTFSRRQPLPLHLERLLTYLATHQCLSFEAQTIHLSSDFQARLELYTAPLANFFEGYLIVCQSLSGMGIKRWESGELHRWIRRRMEASYYKEEIFHPEANSRFLIENALKSFRDQGLIKEDIEGWGARRRVFYTVNHKNEQSASNISILINNIIRKLQ